MASILMPAKGNRVSSWRNHSAGLLRQNGGTHTAATVIEGLTSIQVDVVSEQQRKYWKTQMQRRAEQKRERKMRLSLFLYVCFYGRERSSAVLRSDVFNLNNAQ